MDGDSSSNEDIYQLWIHYLSLCTFHFQCKSYVKFIFSSEVNAKFERKSKNKKKKSQKDPSKIAKGHVHIQFSQCSIYKIVVMYLSLSLESLSFDIIKQGEIVEA